ncbi:MAG: formate dehydrogenase accessory sulfurtransferase FdhD [Deltaproteobacteria bacterium]|nr:formate dehydrogenase accessory sulfurtransferase FdhD [Deltaproteobacteria bacterium]MBW1928694.1 formate dehydrogenase accessory sulfurtransferase FdhD [Deltaproteobacteria bacterium]MBW2127703.1 formate dehydrogenase accessory sulfurtransferase FdhD [Deltaproteobacteria bacterium]
MESRTFRALIRTEKGFASVREELIEEVPLEIVINKSTRVLIMHTPYMTRELVYGFLFTEGYVPEISHVLSCHINFSEQAEGIQIMEAHVQTTTNELEAPPSAGPQRISYSSCGICGREELEEMRRGLSRIRSAQRFSMDLLQMIPQHLQDLQPLYTKTKAAHAAVLFDAAGRVVMAAEDLGRHNAIDKVIGKCLLEGIPRQDKVIVSSGRASLEMILKVVRGGFPLFVAMSRPTSRAVEAAKFYNLTLIDLAKETNRIYTHARRLKEY